MMSPQPRLVSLAFAALLLAYPAFGHVGDHPSVHDTVARIHERLTQTFPHDRLNDLGVAEVMETLTDEERHILATEHLRFTVNAPVRVIILHDSRFAEAEPFEPFWIPERGFQRIDPVVERGSDIFHAYARDFPAGPIALGVNSVSGSNQHYFVALESLDPEVDLEVTDLYPGFHTLIPLEEGAHPYLHPAWGPVTAVPEALAGLTMVRTDPHRRRDARLTSIYNETRRPATTAPDQIVLTWSDDPRTTQTIQWRTSTAVESGAVAYMTRAQYRAFDRGEPEIAAAETKVLKAARTVNDPVVRRHTAVLRGLEPGTTYVYAVGDGSEAGWTEPAEFTTAPEGVAPFSFIYMGDAQNGLDRWGTLLRNAFRERPDAAFYLMAGDLVNRGNDRDDWDDFFHNAEGVFDRRQLVPLLGNHEYHGGQEPHLYHDLFTLMDNGPDTIPPQRAYAFEYSNALFVILDSNLPPEDQTDWLDETLANSDATWKFVAYHHPAYGSSMTRDSPWLREHWVPLFDKHRVDMALQGHDHAYLRTYPMRDHKPVDSTDEGTVYVISVAGTKMYRQGDFDYAEVGFTNVATYQVLDIQIAGDRLVYRAYDLDGNLKDELIIEK